MINYDVVSSFLLLSSQALLVWISPTSFDAVEVIGGMAQGM
jgi:hypothetical protein